MEDPDLVAREEEAHLAGASARANARIVRSEAVEARLTARSMREQARLMRQRIAKELRKPKSS